MVGITRITALVGLAFGVTASCGKYAVELEPFYNTNCLDHQAPRGFTMHEGHCHTHEFRKTPAAAVRIHEHKAHKSKYDIDNKKRACRIHWYESKKCRGDEGVSPDLHLPGVFDQCFNTTLTGKNTFPHGIRSARLHCDTKGPELWPVPQSRSTRIYTSIITDIIDYKFSKPPSTRTTWSTITDIIDATTRVCRNTTKTETLTFTPRVMSNSSSIKTATIKRTTTVLAPPTATIEGTTTVWVASSSSSTPKVRTATSVVTITDDDDTSVTMAPRDVKPTSSATTTVYAVDDSEDTSTLDRRAVMPTLTATTASPSEELRISYIAHDTSTTIRWVRTITNAIDRRDVQPTAADNAPGRECYISVDGRWLISSCADASKPTGQLSA
ncbi:Hypothetical protein D9617_7g031750 [Elsinoe fawcettii]|nr:Hypothetical protein D9617_7g031750 [Elsinoe fawcettii]